MQRPDVVHFKGRLLPDDLAVLPRRAVSGYDSKLPFGVTAMLVAPCRNSMRMPVGGAAMLSWTETGTNAAGSQQFARCMAAPFVHHVGVDPVAIATCATEAPGSSHSASTRALTSALWRLRVTLFASVMVFT